MSHQTYKSHYDLCIASSCDDEVVKSRIQANFPPECQTLFEYITSFLRELCRFENNQGTYLNKQPNRINKQIRIT